MKMNEKEVIVLVHGLWMKGLELLYIRYKLWRQGYKVYQFHYASVFKSPEENAAKLYQYVSNIEASTVHFVAHSLGGIVVDHLFHKYDIKQPGKVVMLGTPINGSAAAIYVAENIIMKYLLGKSTIKGLLGDAPKWNYKRNICVIAGTQGIGIGQILASKAMQRPNDGTVNFIETQLENADESHEVPRSHFLLLFSKDVVNISLDFLRK